MIAELTAGIKTALRPKLPTIGGRTDEPGSRSRLVALVAGALLVAVLFGTAVGQLTSMVNSVAACYVLGAVQTLPLLLIRVAPLLTWQMVALGMFAGTLSGLVQDEVFPWPAASCIAAGLSLYRVARVHSPNVGAAAALVSFLAVVVPTVLTVRMPPFALLIIAATLAAITAAGVVMKRLSSAESALEDEQQLRMRQERRQAVIEERARIARELHDVVAHHMSMIAVQAQAARFKSPGLPPEAIAAFDDIHRASATALTEMRQVIEVLRDSGEATEHSPAPNLSDIDALVGQWRAAGAHVTLNTDGEFDKLPEALSTTVYRILQESLSNAARHAPGMKVEARLTRTNDELRVAVGNEIGQVSADPRGQGHGLVGIEERTAAFGGRLSAGMTNGGRYEVTVLFPVRGQVTAPGRDIGDAPSTVEDGR
ncbi:histidine kinase [Rhodococcus sp. H29-C3]|uniref:sensor histidine kinase n=1 Tax=Rhodococcus sp. H29-C3 TaxID=3046307 RepID=UPI0024B9A2DA|nr:histidine kinase [Rhodococcus sp. H29-C3]MDJ0363101.1 histidine kinase [Rhodococcus sp. H29-C3]